MKRFILLLVAIFIAKLATAQQIETSIRINYNSANWYGDVWKHVTELTQQSGEIASLKNRNGISGGVYVGLPLDDLLYLESGLVYDQKGVGVRVRPFESIFSPQIKSTVKLNYLSIPLNLHVKVADGLYLTGGGAVSKLLNSKLAVRGSWLGIGAGDSFPIQRAFNEWDFSLQGGLLYQFENGFHLKAEYKHGLTRINGGIINADVFNRGISVGAGFRF